MLTLAIYDITDTKARTKLSKHLMRFGFYRIQKSGFLGNIEHNDRDILNKELKQYIKDENDSIYIVPLTESSVSMCRIISKQDLEIGVGGKIMIVG